MKIFKNKRNKTKNKKRNSNFIMFYGKVNSSGSQVSVKIRQLLIGR